MPGIPTVSVLIPTYNYARYLPEAIESVLSQQGVDYELIISDDASTDDSAAVLARYAAAHPEIKICVQPANLGMVENWNWCLRQARGEFVKFLFGDDRLSSPEALRGFVDLLAGHPAAVLGASARRIIDERSQPTDLWHHLPPRRVLPGSQVIYRCLLEDKNLIGEPTAVIFRRAAANRGFSTRLRQVVDLEMWFHLLTRGGLVCTDRPLCDFRQHGLQQTARNRQAWIGPWESLLITGDYLDFCRSDPGCHIGEFSRHRILHRRLHYAFKRLPRTAEFTALEDRLRAGLNRPWYLAAWAVHRLQRPGQNLAAVVRRKRHASK